MKLKYRVKTLDGLSPEIAAMYVQDGDSYVLQVEGAVDRSKLDEFRNNNVRLSQDLERFRNIDPARYQELEDLQRQLDEQELIRKGDVDGVVEGRTKKMRETFEKEKTEMQKMIDSANANLNILLIDNAATLAATSLGVAKSAIPDLVSRARGAFKVKDGKAVMLDESGQVVFGKDGTTPLSVTDWATDLRESAPHLFERSAGAGSRGSYGGGSNTDSSKMSATQLISAGLKDL